MNFKLSLIIPVYNAEKFIIQSLYKISEWKKNLEFSTQVILVNDGSIDSTKNIIEDYIISNDPSIELLSYPQNRGKGYAVKKGMLAASGKFRIFTDADIPFGFDSIIKTVYFLDFKEFDICVGNRKRQDSEYLINVNPLRKLSSILFTIIISRYVITGINDTQCGLKGFREDTAIQLFSNIQTRGFAFDVELLYLSYKCHYEIKRIPVKFIGNSYSTIRLSKDSVQMFWDVLRLPFRWHFSNRYKKIQIKCE
jgi:dolichyl-phosphate beta-glucosyltransferase